MVGAARWRFDATIAGGVRHCCRCSDVRGVRRLGAHRSDDAARASSRSAGNARASQRQRPPDRLDEAACRRRGHRSWHDIYRLRRCTSTISVALDAMEDIGGLLHRPDGVFLGVSPEPTCQQHISEIPSLAANDRVQFFGSKDARCLGTRRGRVSRDTPAGDPGCGQAGPRRLDRRRSGRTAAATSGR